MGLSAYAGVRTPSGEKRAEDIAAGDAVLDGAGGGEARVTKTLNSPGVGMVRVCAEGDVILDLTGDHAVLTAAGAVAAGTLASGTLLRTATGFARCTGVEAMMGDYMVYDITVDGGGALVAGGILVEARR